MTAQIQQLLIQAATRYGVDPQLVVAQAQQESGGNQYKSDGSLVISKAGAIGVMQLMPATAAELGVDPTDTAQNIDGGVRYLANLLRQFGGNVSLALAAYDWGPGRVAQNGFSNWPAETWNYVKSILGAIGSSFAAQPVAVDQADGFADQAPTTTTGPSAGEILGLLIAAGVLVWFASGSM